MKVLNLLLNLHELCFIAYLLAVHYAQIVPLLQRTLSPESAIIRLKYPIIYLTAAADSFPR